MGWRGPIPGRATMWCGPPEAPLPSPFHLYIAPDMKTLRHRAKFHEKFCHSCHREPKFGGQKSLFRHPARMGNCPQSHLHRLHRQSSSPLLTPMTRRE
jgi:hypothetical protein